MPSQPVRSLDGISGLEKYLRHVRGLRPVGIHREFITAAVRRIMAARKGTPAVDLDCLRARDDGRFAPIHQPGYRVFREHHVLDQDVRHDPGWDQHADFRVHYGSRRAEMGP